MASTSTAAELIESDLAPIVGVTVHPSSILRIRDDDERGLAREQISADLAFLCQELDRIG